MVKQLKATAVCTLAGLAALLLVELALRLLNIGHSNQLILEQGGRGSEFLYLNDKFAHQYLPRLHSSIPTPSKSVLFRRKKDPDTYRIFVIGESTSQGFPYVSTEAFPFQIGEMLSNAGVNCEVINLSMSAISSYVGVDIAEEVADLDPDLVLVYFGHNEFLGIGGSAAHEGLLFKLNKHASTLRLYQSLKKLISRTDSNTEMSLMQRMSQAPGIPYGGDRFNATIEAFERNYSLIVGTLKSAGAEVLTMGVVRNTRDFPPIRTQRSKNRAERETFVSGIDRLIEGLQFGDREISTQDALENYLIGRALHGHGLFEQAKRYLENACDFELIRFRAPSDINRKIETVSEANGCVYFDSQVAIDGLAFDGIAGNESLVDQVHPSQLTHRFLARKATETIIESYFPDAEIDRTSS